MMLNCESLTFYLTLLDFTFYFFLNQSLSPLLFDFSWMKSFTFKFSFTHSYTNSLNEIQQSLLYDSVVSADVGCTIALNIQCGSLPFNLAKVINVSEEKVTVFIYTNYNSDLKGVWSLSGSLIKTYPKRYTMRKHMDLQQLIY